MDTPAVQLMLRPDQPVPVGGHVVRLGLDEGIEVEIRSAPPVAGEGDRRLLSAVERRRHDRFRREVDRARYAVGRRLLRQAVAERRGVAPEAVEVRAVPAPALVGAGDGGRPVVPGGPRGISIAHGGDLVLIAVCDEVFVGIDVEPIAAEARIGEVESTLLGPAERAALDRRVAARGGGRDGELLRAWTRKEAVLKAAGVGLTVVPTAVMVEGDGGPRVVATGAGLPDAARFLLRDLDVGPGHVASLALLRAR